MATMNLRGVRLTLTWHKDDPANFTYDVKALAMLDDDTEPSGERLQNASDLDNTIGRGAFRGLTGAQIENQMQTLAVAALQALGTGAGTHTINIDVG
jgi:hypothetical protein